MSKRRRQSLNLGFSRRQFLWRAGVTSTAIGTLPLLSHCGDDERRRGTFHHGVASGDPLSDRVLLWTHVSGGGGDIPVDYVVATDPGLANVVKRGSANARRERDHTVQVDVAGLTPATTYYYRFTTRNDRSPIGRTRTLPDGPVDHLRIGVVSCASYAHGFFNALRRVAERSDLDLVLFLGDYIYEYGSGDDGKEPYGTFRRYDPPREVLSLRDYRLRHAQYKSDPDLQELHRQHPVIAIWDDHETADNSFATGALNHTPDEGDWNDRVDAALEAYYEWLPVRRPDPSRPRVNYRSFRLGDLAEIVLLEERLAAREEQLPGTIEVEGTNAFFVPLDEVTSEDREMLGAEQEAWLASTLRASPTTWKLLAHGVMLAHFKAAGLPGAAPTTVFVNPDQWDGYPMARERLFDVIDGADGGPPVANVVSLAADIHSSWANDLARDPNNPVPALGGYDPLTGAGALGVELVATSATAPGLEAVSFLEPLVPVMNPHMRYVDFSRRGYLLLDLTPARVVAEHWYIPTITEVSSNEELGAALQVTPGSNHLTPSSPTSPRPNPPAPAP